MSRFQDHVANYRSQWPEALLQLIEGGRQEAEARAAEQAAQKAKQEAQAQAARKETLSHLYEHIVAQVPAELVTAMPDLLPDLKQQISETDPADWTITAVHRSPGLAPIRFSYYRKSNARYDGGLSIAVAESEHYNGDAPHWKGWTGFDDPADLLYHAAARCARFEDLQAKYDTYLEQQTAEQEAAETAYYSKSVAQTAEREAKKLEEEIEAERLIAWARSDPAVLHLIRAFIAIEQERIELSRRLDVASEEANDAWTYYESRRAELEQRSATARADAERYEREARAAQDEADQLRRQVKECGR